LCLSPYLECRIKSNLLTGVHYANKSQPTYTMLAGEVCISGNDHRLQMGNKQARLLIARDCFQCHDIRCKNFLATQSRFLFAGALHFFCAHAPILFLGGRAQLPS
jgi:hypothetical protein